MVNVKKVSAEEMHSIIETREPLGLFYMDNERGGYTACSNEDGDAWTEDFDTKVECAEYLFDGEIELKMPNGDEFFISPERLNEITEFMKWSWEIEDVCFGEEETILIRDIDSMRV